MVTDSEPKPRLVRLFSGVTVLLSVLPLKSQIPATPVYKLNGSLNYDESDFIKL